MKIDFISDVTCPWCAIGLHALRQAMARVAGRVTIEFRLHPYELNPGLPLEGEPIADYAARKYGASVEQMARRQALIRARAAALGLDFPVRTHVYNTFDAHRLLQWAAPRGRQLDLKLALLRAYHERGANPASTEVLLGAAGEVGFDSAAAAHALASGAHADDVRSAVQRWQRLGIDGVPAVVIDGQHLLQGAQPVEVYEQVLRRFAARQSP